MLKVVILGCGLISSKKHIPIFLKLGNKVKIVAICDLNLELAKNAASKFGIEKFYSDYNQMLSSETPDIVVICTPPQTHAKLTVQALESGAHVLLEKPMALSVSDCDLMIEAANKYKKKLCIMHNQIFNPAFTKAKNLLLNGEIGEFIGAHLFLSTPSDYMTSIENHWAHKLPGGVLGETGPHSVYLLTSFLKDVYDVSVLAKKLLPVYPWSNFEDYRILLFAKNGFGSIIQTYASNQWASDLEIFGTTGILKVDLQAKSVIKYNRSSLSPFPLGVSQLNGIVQQVVSLTSSSFNFILGKTWDAHSIGITQFVDSILENKSFPVLGEHGRENVEIVEMLVKKLKDYSNKAVVFK